MQLSRCLSGNRADESRCVQGRHIAGCHGSPVQYVVYDKMRQALACPFGLLHGHRDGGVCRTFDDNVQGSCCEWEQNEQHCNLQLKVGAFFKKVNAILGKIFNK